jgi:nucleoside-diphosphate-sugar epimerase
MRVAVTGGTGFIGQRLVKRLLSAGHSVNLASRNAPHAAVPVAGLRYFKTDLASDFISPEFLQDVDVLFHCAGEINNPDRMHDLHVEGTRRLAAAAAGKISHWVQLSSTGAYGPRRNGIVLDNDPERPVGKYEETKVASDRLVIEAGRAGTFSFSILRPSIVFGGGMRNRSLYALMRMIERGWFFHVGRPGASANYIHVDNVVHALMLCAFNPRAAGHTFIISDYWLLEQFIADLAGCLGVPVPVRRLPEAVVRAVARIGELIPGWPLRSSRVDALTNFAQYSTTLIRTRLGYAPVMGLHDGLTELTQFYRSSGT